jgi:hypothetical protein
MLTRLKLDINQSAIDMCHVCHVAVRPTPKGKNPDVVGGNPPTWAQNTVWPHGRWMVSARRIKHSRHSNERCCRKEAVPLSRVDTCVTKPMGLARYVIHSITQNNVILYKRCYSIRARGCRDFSELAGKLT